MDPNRKITKKFTKKFDCKVINRQYFHRKTQKQEKNAFFVFLGYFYAYLGQPHDHKG